MKRFTPIYQRPVVLLDTETTDLEPGEDRGEMLEIALADIHGRTLLETKLLPRHIETANSKALEINGYDEEVWAKEAVTFESIAQEVADHMSGAVLIGQNPFFDRKFIMYELNRLGINTWGVSYHMIDTATLVYEHLTPPCGSISLDWACCALGISNEGAHTAMADVQRTRRVYLKLKRATWMHRLWWYFASTWRLREKRSYLKMKDYKTLGKKIDGHPSFPNINHSTELRELVKMEKEMWEGMTKKECEVLNEWHQEQSHGGNWPRS